jgi:hypothetical protein
MGKSVIETPDVWLNEIEMDAMFVSLGNYIVQD